MPKKSAFLITRIAIASGDVSAWALGVELGFVEKIEKIAKQIKTEKANGNNILVIVLFIN
jgi:hypothetical protein